MLRFQGIEKRFGAVQALDGLDMEVAPGQVVGFLGANGAGKTTAMRVVFGMVRQDAGTVTWNGGGIDWETRARFGYMPEERGLYAKMGVADQLVYFGTLHGMEHQDARRSTFEWLDRFGLGDRRDARVETLSHGNQQRVQLIAALLHRPPLLVLDEPFSGLDPLAAGTMADVLRERSAAGAAVLFSSHQLDTVEDLCEDVVIIDHGRRIVGGRVADIRASSPVRLVEIVGPAADHVSRWTGTVDGARVMETAPGIAVLEVPAETHPHRIAALAAETGPMSSFSFEPPDLSQVFRQAVAP